MAGEIRKMLDPFCRPEFKVRENFFSDTYRKEFNLNGETGQWDITRIRIPFPAEKEAAFVRNNQVKDAEELAEFYQILLERIRMEREMLHMISQQDETVKSNFVSYVAQRAVKLEDGPEWGRDYYFISRPMDPLFGSEFVKNSSSITLLETVTLATRFTQTLKALQNAGLDIHLGAIDLDDFFVINERGRARIVCGSLIYGGDSTGGKQLLCVPQNAHDTVQNGVGQSVNADLYAIGNALWSITGGNHWSSKPDLQMVPQYAPDKLVEIVILCREGGESALREVHAKLHALIKEIKYNPTSENPLIPIPPRPFYTTDVPESRDSLGEGWEMVSNSVIASLPEENGEWDFVDVPIEVPNQSVSAEPSIDQSAPLKPKKAKRPQDDNKKQESRLGKREKLMISATVLAVIAVFIFIWQSTLITDPVNTEKEPVISWDIEEQAWPEPENKEESEEEPEMEPEEEPAEKTEEFPEETKPEEKSTTVSNTTKVPASSSSGSSHNSTSKSGTRRPSSSAESTVPSSTSRPSNQSGTSTSSPSTSPSSIPSNSSSENGSETSSGNNSNSGTGTGSQPSAPPVAQTPTFSVTPTSISLSVGGTVSLSANAPCSMSSSNLGVAYVSGRSVVGVSPGTCIITCVNNSGISRSVVVTVH